MKTINCNLNIVGNQLRKIGSSVSLALSPLIGKASLCQKNIMLEKDQALLQEQNFHLARKIDILENLINSQNSGEICKGNQYKTAKKVAVLGSAQLPVYVIFAIAKAFGYDKGNIEVYGDYNKNKRLDTRIFRNTGKYNGILLGPIAHKVVGLGSNSSVLSKISSEPGYPRCCIIQTKSGHLKITKTALKEAFMELSRYPIMLENVA